MRECIESVADGVTIACDHIQMIQQDGKGCKIMVGGQWFAFPAISYADIRTASGLTQA